MWRFVRIPIKQCLSLKCAYFRLNARKTLSQSSFSFLALIPSIAFIWPFRKQEDVDPTTKVKSLFYNSLKFIAAGEFERAEKQLHELLFYLSDCHQQKQFSDSEYITQRARVYSEMANLNLILGKHTNAEKLLKQVIQDCLNVGIPINDARIVELSLKLALIYENMKKISDAEIGFNFCINTQMGKLSNSDEITDRSNEEALLGMSCNYFAKFLYNNSRPREALSFVERALKIAQQIYPIDHSNCLFLMIDKSLILVELEQWNQAYDLLMNVLQLNQTKIDQLPKRFTHSQPEQQLDAYELFACQLHTLVQLGLLGSRMKMAKVASQVDETLIINKLNSLLNQIKVMNLKNYYFEKLKLIKDSYDNFGKNQ